MTGMTNRVNVLISFGLIIGLGIFMLLIIQTRAVTASAETASAPSVTVAPGVKLKFQTDKSIYQATEVVLAALRNDSRKSVWLTTHADGCSDSWWKVQRLDTDGENWLTVALSKTTCASATYGSQAFDQHTVVNGQWNIRVPSNQLGDLVMAAPTGTYRLAAPYIVAPKQPAEADWASSKAQVVATPSFTVQ